jgi:hypothetical protein
VKKKSGKRSDGTRMDGFVNALWIPRQATAKATAVKLLTTAPAFP